MELIQGIIMDWVISSVWSSQVITALQTIHFYNALLLFPTPAMVVSAVKNTTLYLLLLLMLMVCFYWFEQKLVRCLVVFIIWRMDV